MILTHKHLEMHINIVYLEETASENEITFLLKWLRCLRGNIVNYNPV